MIFCLGKGKYESEGDGYQKNYRIFNKEVSKEIFDKYYSNPNFKLLISVWINKKDMTEKEIKDHSICNQIGGYLKVLSYKDAWKEGWKTASKEFKEWVKSLPNFDAEIFYQITGIKFEEEVEELTVAEICERLGKTIKIKK